MIQKSPFGVKGPAYLAIFEGEHKGHLVTIDGSVRDLGGYPSLSGFGLPRPCPDFVVVRHAGETVGGFTPLWKGGIEELGLSQVAM